MDEDQWASSRAYALSRLEEHMRAGKVDQDIVEFLAEFNRDRECMFTTSSCSGRIVVLRGRSLFDKRGAEIVYSSHSAERCLEVLDNIEGDNPGGNDLITWISLQPPILHIAAKTLEDAESVVRCGVRAGFTRTCYRRMKPLGYHVEIAAHDKLHIILPAERHALEEVCNVLRRYKARLKTLIDCLRSLTCT
ncbi:MAG: hypothetical protein F7C38_01840 [Desulfurococcales archaeon]|nr:hypothetical protein [Desulfurococcales archaeon]